MVSLYLNFTFALHARTLHELYMGRVNLIETFSGGGGHRTREERQRGILPLCLIFFLLFDGFPIDSCFFGTTAKEVESG